MSEPAKIKCPHCFGEIDPRAAICPHCRKNLRTSSPLWHIGSLIMAAGLLILIAGLFVDPFIVVLGVLGMAVGYVVRKFA